MKIQPTIPAPHTPAPHPLTQHTTTPGDVSAPTSSQRTELNSLLLSPPSHHHSPGEDRDTGGSPQGFTAPLQTQRTISPPLIGASPLSSMRNQVLSLSDVTSLLPRREFKLHGGQISDTGFDVSFGSLCKQIDEGLKKGFTESEVIRGVLKITKPGNFRERLTNG